MVDGLDDLPLTVGLPRSSWPSAACLEGHRIGNSVFSSQSASSLADTKKPPVGGSFAAWTGSLYQNDLAGAWELLSQVPEGGVPRGIRTPVAAVKGRCPGPLDDGDGTLGC